MKHSRADVRGKARLGLDIRFESQSLTSYSGLIVFQRLFSLIGIKERLWRCFPHQSPHFKYQMTPNIPRYTRCSISIRPNASINGRRRYSGQFAICSYSINP